MGSNFDKTLVFKKDLATKQMELQKLNIEISGLSREILEVQTALHQLNKARDYMKESDAVVSLREFKDIMVTIHSQNKRKTELRSAKKDKEEQRKIVDGQIKTLKHKNSYSEPVESNVLQFPIRNQ